MEDIYAIFERRRLAEKSGCCSNCSHSIDNNLTRRVQELRVQDVENCEQKKEVQFNSWENQVVMTTNAPPCFQLSLDFVPCFQPLEGEKQGWIAGSSNGLLLCTTKEYMQTLYYVCDPVKKQGLALPPTPRTPRWAHVGFVYDPCSAASTCPEHQLTCTVCRFKVVRFQHGFKFEVESFSSEDPQWRIVKALTPEVGIHWENYPRKRKSILHMGCLHWLSPKGELVVYDPYNYTFQGLIKGPPKRETCMYWAFEGFSLCNNSFWLCHYSKYSQQFRIWELNGYTSVAPDELDKCYWSLRHHFHFDQLSGGRDWAQELLGAKFLSFHPYDPDVFYLQLHKRRGPGFVVPCNLQSKSLGPAMGCTNVSSGWEHTFTLSFPDILSNGDAKIKSFERPGLYSA